MPSLPPDSPVSAQLSPSRFSSTAARPAGDHPVGAVLRSALAGGYPPVDGRVAVVAPWRAGTEAVVQFSGHAIVATTRSLAQVLATGIDATGNAFAPDVARALAGVGGSIDGVDVVLLAAGTGRTSLPERRALDDHPRAQYARAWRDGVHVHGDERGLVTVSRGLGGLAELSVEVVPDLRGRRLGAALLEDARGLVPEGEPVTAQVAIGNARALRTALAAGFRPIGAAQLIRPGWRSA